MGMAFAVLNVFGGAGEWPLPLAVLFLLAGLVGSVGILLSVWMQLLKTPLWLAVPLAAFLGTGVWAAAHAAWGKAVMALTDFDPMSFL